MPQLPQSALDDVRSAQTPAQSVVPAGHTQAEFVHTKLLAHACPQKPQLPLSFVRSTHDVPHLAMPAPQFTAHAPLLQTCPPVHRLPHMPQLLPSELTSAHVPAPPPPIPKPPMHAVSPVGQLQLPPLHVAPFGHTLPQPPQSRVFVCVSTHAPFMPHDVSPVGQPAVHVPLTHWLPGPQRFPHVPQLRGSLVVSVHTPLQLVVPAPHVHVPLEQLAPVEQMLPQVPQLLGSVDVSVHALLQSVCPVAHDPAHMPLEHTGVAPVHAVAHVPQLFGSLSVSVHTPLHRVPLL